MSTDFDVIVVGGGGAGMAAALTAAEEGARVLLIEAAERCGGSTALSGGVYYAAGTSVQRQAGIEGDTADAMFLYYMTLNQHKVEPSLVRALCDGAAPGLEWLISLGVRFPVEGLYASGVERLARGHAAAGHGAEIAEVLEGHLSGKSVEIATHTRVRRLVQDGSGAVLGVEADGRAVTANAVVLTTGGMGADTGMLSRHYPEAAGQAERAWYIGSKHCRGDGLDLGETVGADVVGHNRGLLLITPGFSQDLEVFLPGWLVYVNRDGRRFVNETTEYAVLSGVVKDQLNGECFALIDEETRLRAPRGPYPAPSWEADALARLADQGRVFRAQTLEALAEAAGIRPGALATTIAQYNADCERGADSRFFKDGALLRPIAAPPFYAVRMRPSIVCLTSTGLRIDAAARVLDRADRPIPGLYAAGETTGGVLGERYIGGGNSVANAIVFGRIAGASAAGRGGHNAAQAA